LSNTEEVKISSKRLEMAKERLERGDEVQRSYLGKLDNKYGALLGSNSKLVFVEEKGFLSKSYNVILDLPYEGIRECTPVDRYKLRITDQEGGQHEFVSDLNASTIDDSLKDLMKAASSAKPLEAEKEPDIL
jgi:hypothetical protein